MEARFAGSQRVGDRRRRRLAVGIDDGIDSPDANDPVQPPVMTAPASTSRTVDGPHTDGARTDSPSTAASPSLNLPSLNLPIAAIIPAAGWKYLAGGLLGLAVSAGIIVAGHFSSRLELIAGPGIADLWQLPISRLGQWYSSLLLLLCAQLAAFIWWARSRSLEDFEGRYWLWIRTAGVWLVLSACVTTEAHHVASGALRSIRMGMSQRDANLGWMIPAGTLGIMLIRALAREMQGCRASRALLLTACTLLFASAAVHLELEAVLSPVSRAILVKAGLLTGHVALFVSMWLHARHVVHVTADPAPGSSRGWRIPRPHFRLSPANWLQARRDRRKAVAVPTPPAGRKVERNKRPAGETNAESATQQPVEKGGSLAATPADRPAKPRIRLDGRHRELHREALRQSESDEGLVADQLEARTGTENRADPAPVAQDPRNSAPAHLPDTAQLTDATQLPDPAGWTADDRSAHRVEPAGDVDEAMDEEPGDGPAKPELRGLSKKQRRRLMQEMRDRERASRQ